MLTEKGRQEAGVVRVIVGSDSGGQCQASFRIHSQRSSCYIFYWANKRMPGYFHTSAISLRVGSKRHKKETGPCEGKTQFLFRKRTDSDTDNS